MLLEPTDELLWPRSALSSPVAMIWWPTRAGRFSGYGRPARAVPEPGAGLAGHALQGRPRVAVTPPDPARRAPLWAQAHQRDVP
jgi:hypothetical protein